MSPTPAATLGIHAPRETRRAPLAAPLFRAAVCSLWAAVMIVLGIATLVDGPGLVPVPRFTFMFLGSAAVAGGSFIFMVLVADRFFSRAARGMVAGLETIAFTVFLGGVIAALVSFGTGV